MKRKKKNPRLAFSLSVSIMLIVRCVTLGALCLSEFLFPICKRGLVTGLTSQRLGRIVYVQVLGPRCLSRFSTYYLPSFFPLTTPGLGGAGEDAGSRTRGLTKVIRLVIGLGWGGRAKA